MKKYIIEVGSTVTKVDEWDGVNLKRVSDTTIEFKKNFKTNGKILSSDIEKLENLVNNLKEENINIFVCGTSIFRNLSNSEREEFLTNFKNKTGYDFKATSQDEENELTVLGATRNISSKVCVFIGGGGSTEIAVCENGKIIESVNTDFGVIDAMEKYEDLNNDTASSTLEEVMSYVKERLNVPSTKCDVLILAGGAHEMFARVAKLKYEENTLYNDSLAPIMMDILTRKSEVKRYYESISLDEIKSRVEILVPVKYSLNKNIN